MPAPVKLTRYNLTMGENDFSSPAAVNPEDARKLQSLIPSISGELERESPALVIATIPVTSVSDPIRAIWEFRHYDGATNYTTHFFVANSTALWRATSPAGPWFRELTVTDIPVFWVLDNVMHISDGTHSWIFDGISYVKAGLDIPINPPAIVVTAGAGTPAIVLVQRYYWTTYADESSTRRQHESSSSPTSAGTGAVNQSGSVVVYQEPGTITISGANVVGVGTAFSQRHVGMKLYTAGLAQAVIASVTDATHLTLASNGSLVSAVHFVIAPVRATHWFIYASASETDTVGLKLIEVPVITVSYTDTSPMVGATGSIFQNIERPLLNDPPNPTRIVDAYQRRAWSRVETNPNFYSLSAYEEVLAEQAGNPYESVPGADPNTVSPDIVNENSLPDQSVQITCIKAHGDAVYFGSEKNTRPLFGKSLDTFDFSDVDAFSVGMAGRHAAVSTPFGFIFLSYDKKLYLYPSQYSFQADATASLIELSRPKRYEFQRIDGSDFPNVQTVFYNYGLRNWLVCTFRKWDMSYATWVFDFEAQGWFQLQQGYTAVAVLESQTGERTLFGSVVDSTNHVYNLVVIDDNTTLYPVADGATYPVGIYRLYTDFGKPNSFFTGKGVEYEVSDPSMEIDVTVWLDPADPDNPGDGIPLLMTQKMVGAKESQGQKSNRFRGTLSSDTGGTAQRILVEFAVAASSVNGKIRGVAVDADELAKDPVL